MSRFCPVYPKPHPEQTSKLRMFWHARRSWMDALFERSYSMQMGEVHLPGVDLYMLNDIKEVKRVMQSEAQQFPKSHLLHESLEPMHFQYLMAGEVAGAYDYFELLTSAGPMRDYIERKLVR